MKVPRLVSAFTLLATLCIGHAADEPAPSKDQMAEVYRLTKLASTLKYQTGEIPLPQAKATISLKDGFRYLDKENARKLLVDVWHNPPDVASQVIGVIVPEGFNPIGSVSWAVTIQSANDGYVKDDEFESMDFNDALKEMREATLEASKARIAAGYGKMELAGWATPPRYDKAQHKLFWAKKFDVDAPDQALNYDIRVLGRAGHLELSLISEMSQLQEIEKQVPTILSMVDFTEGNRYADFRSGDKVASYGVAALITGGVLAKTGILKALLLFLVKGWKIVLVGIAAIAYLIKRIVSGRAATR